MSNTYPIVPTGDGLDDSDNPATREVDGEKVLDTDADDDLIDSAEADRLASTDPEEVS